MRLAGGVIGAVIGGMVGAPQIGWAVGSMIGGMLEPPQQFSQEGPRLTDLTVTNSNYGVGIKKIWGTVRTPGNIIFSSALKETKHVTREEQGGKGGPTAVTTITTYTYAVDCAFLISEGEVQDLRRIFNNGKLIYDVSEKNDGFIGGIEGGIKFYRGTRDQEVDPTIEKNLGVGNTPAYRGYCYIVFDNLQLAEFNNQVPFGLQFEVVRAQTNEDVGIIKSSINEFITDARLLSSTSLSYNEYDKFTYFIALKNNVGYGDLNYIYKYDAFNNILVDYKQISEYSILTNSKNGARLLFQKNGTLIVSATRVSDQKNGLLTIDCDTLTVKNFSTASTTEEPLNNVKQQVPWMFTKNNDRLIQFAYSMSYLSNTFYTFSYENTYFLSTVNVSKFNYNLAENNGGTSINVDVSVNKGIACFKESRNEFYFCNSFNNYKNQNKSTLVLCRNQNMEFKILKEIDGRHSISIEEMYYDIVSDSIFVIYTLNDNETYFLKHSLSNDTIEEHLFKIEDKNIVIAGRNNKRRYVIFNNKRNVIFSCMTVTNSNLYYVEFNIDTFEYNYLNITNDDTLKKIELTSKHCYIEDLSSTLFLGSPLNQTIWDRSIIKFNGRRIKNASYPLDLVVKEILSESGIDMNSVDTKDLENDVVHGFWLTSTMTRRSALQTLATAYNFEQCQSESKIKFIKNGKEAVKTIYLDEIGADTFNNEIKFKSMTTEKNSELDLPSIVNVNFADINKDLQTNTQDAINVNSNSNNILNQELSLALYTNEAKNIAERLLEQAVNNREMYTFSTSFKYIDIEPTDVIYLKSRNESKLYKMKISKKETDVGIIKWTAIAEDSAIYSQNHDGYAGEDTNQKIPVISSSKITFLDIPALRNEDVSETDCGVYALSSRLNSRMKWDGSTLLMSNKEDGGYTEIETFFNSAIVGSTIDYLKPFDFNVIDGQTVNVRYNGTLETISENDLLNSYNLAIIGNEIVNFQNAILIDENTYQLSNIVRGRFGTERFKNTHQTGERFILLNQSSETIKRILNDISLIGIDRFFKNVTFNESIYRTYATNFKNEAISLMPFSVKNISGIKELNGDFNVSFNKQVRGFYPMKDSTDVFDIDNDFYEIEIYSSNNFNEVKRKLSIQNTNFKYTLAEQIEDFGITQNTIYLKIYKMNKIVGRGFEAKATIVKDYI